MGGQLTSKQVRITSQAVQNASSWRCEVVQQQEQSRHDLMPARQPGLSRLIFLQFSGIEPVSKRQGLAKTEVKTFPRKLASTLPEASPASTTVPRNTRSSLRVAVTASRWAAQLATPQTAAPSRKFPRRLLKIPSAPTHCMNRFSSDRSGHRQRWPLPGTSTATQHHILWPARPCSAAERFAGRPQKPGLSLPT